MIDLRDALAGAAGALCLTIVGAPLDLVKTAAQTGAAVSPAVAARRVLAAHGPLGLWRGAGPAFASALTENVVLFSAHGALARAAGGGEPTPAGAAALGGAAAVASATAICPAEVVKVRAQAAAAAGGGGGGALALWRADGARGFFRGLAPLVARDVPLIGVMFCVERGVDAALAARGAGADARALLGGGMGGAVAWAVVFPLDVAKSRLQARALPGGLLSTLREAARERALYAGVSAAVVRAFAANAALFYGVRKAEAVLRA